MTALADHPTLVVLDGFERLLNAFHRYDSARLADEAVELSERSMIEPNAEQAIRQLVEVAPSKILISTRLMPRILEGQFGGRLPGVRHIRLPGLSDQDVIQLLRRLGIRGEPSNFVEFFRPLGNHPLLTGIVAGLVHNYHPAPGNFDAWLADPLAGAALNVAAIDLKPRGSCLWRPGPPPSRPKMTTRQTADVD